VATSTSRTTPLAGGDALHEPIDRQIFAGNAVERRQEPAEHVIPSPHRAAALDREQVLDATDHAQDRRVAARVTADRADRRLAVCTHLGHMTADGARPDVVPQLGERAAEVTRDALVAHEQGERVALRRLFSHAGELRQELHDPKQSVGEHEALAPRSRATCPGS
jgi:hypothetical protein